MAIIDETPERADERLRNVIASARFEVLTTLYAFQEIPDPGAARHDALACIRDDEVWSQLVPVDTAATPGAFCIFVFHFDPGLDGTGFVGWLHSKLTRATGTGAIVVCGKDGLRGGSFDHVRGGIFDYWGCSAQVADAAIATVHALIQCGASA